MEYPDSTSVMPPATIHAVATVARLKGVGDSLPTAVEPAAVASGSHFFCFSTMGNTLRGALQHRLYNEWANIDHPMADLMIGRMVLFVLQVLEGREPCELPLSKHDLAALLVVGRHADKFDLPQVVIAPHSRYELQRKITVKAVGAILEHTARLPPGLRECFDSQEQDFLHRWGNGQDYLATEEAAVDRLIRERLPVHPMAVQKRLRSVEPDEDERSKRPRV